MNLFLTGSTCEQHTCGINARCTLNDGRPVCSCHNLHMGDPLTRCDRVECLSKSNRFFFRFSLIYQCRLIRMVIAKVVQLLVPASSFIIHYKIIHVIVFTHIRGSDGFFNLAAVAAAPEPKSIDCFYLPRRKERKK